MESTSKILSNEHQNILKVIEALLNECSAIENGKEIEVAFFTKAIDFVRNYADKFHHAKEEDILFVELCKDEVEMHCNPVEQMLHEHDLGRNFIKELEKGVKEGDKDKVVENARGYAYLLQEHISKEDNVLYPMADEVLSQEVKEKMLVKFKEVEQKSIKEKEKYENFVKEVLDRNKDD